ncbi:MAG: hypothetical protein HYX94_07230 [Chloroflexi bacterium]|nr:hypothetical protein [Chloroflexota bacterium]
MRLEKLGVPTVTFVADWFMPLAEAAKKAGGMPDLPFVTVPYPFDTLSRAEVLLHAERVLEEAVSAVAVGPYARVSRKTLPS